MIDFSCPTCGQELSAEDNLRGTLAQCPQCGANIQVPSLLQSIQALRKKDPDNKSLKELERLESQRIAQEILDKGNIPKYLRSQSPFNMSLRFQLEHPKYVDDFVKQVIAYDQQKKAQETTKKFSQRNSNRQTVEHKEKPRDNKPVSPFKNQELPKGFDFPNMKWMVKNMEEEPPIKIDTTDLPFIGFAFLLLLVVPLAYCAFGLAPIPTGIAAVFGLYGIIQEAKCDAWRKAGEVFEIAKNRAVSRTAEMYPEILSGYKKAKIREHEEVRKLIEDNGGDPDEVNARGNAELFRRISADGGDPTFLTKFFTQWPGMLGASSEMLKDVDVHYPKPPYKSGIIFGTFAISYLQLAGIAFFAGIVFQAVLFYGFDIDCSWFEP